MFHFGLFSSFLPYLVIAAIYFCGLASYSVDVVNEHICKDQKKTYNNEVSQLSIAANYAVIEFQDYVSDEKKDPFNKGKIYSLPAKEYWLVIDDRPDDCLLSNYLFSRPPPSLS